MLRFRSASVYLSFSVSMVSSVFAFDIHPFSLRLYFSLSSIALQVTSRILLIVHCLKFSAYLADSACIPMCMWVSLSLPLSISLSLWFWLLSQTKATVGVSLLLDVCLLSVCQSVSVSCSFSHVYLIYSRSVCPSVFSMYASLSRSLLLSLSLSIEETDRQRETDKET